MSVRRWIRTRWIGQLDANVIAFTFSTFDYGKCRKCNRCNFLKKFNLLFGRFDKMIDCVL